MCTHHLIRRREDAFVPRFKRDEIAVNTSDGLGDGVNGSQDDGAQEMNHSMLCIRYRLDTRQGLV